jgi:hypothetical protein
MDNSQTSSAPMGQVEIVNKYIDREGLFDSIIRNKLENLYQDLGWSLQLNEHVSKFFNF